MTTPFDSVFLVAFGGPPKGEQGYEFVKGIVGNRPGAEARIREVAHHYEVLGGSPFNRLTFEQAEALAGELARRGITLPVRVGFRHWTPFVHETIREMRAAGLSNAVGVVMAPHQCWVADEKYRLCVDAAIKEIGGEEVRFTYTDNFGKHYAYVRANADLIRQVAEAIGPERWARAKLVFSAHSVPVNGCEPCTNKLRTCPYPTHYEQTAKYVAEAVGKPDHALAYQSRAETRRPWTGPDIVDVIKTLAAEGVKEIIISPIGFLCDHVEVLYDLDIEARRAAEELGLTYNRARTVQSHPKFVEMLADLVQARIRTQMPV